MPIATASDDEPATQQPLAHLLGRDSSSFAAMTKKLSFDVCKVNRELRIVMDPNREIIASQDKTTWEATLGPPH